jgi:predicted RNase H-like HicB family nuclease
LIFKVVLELAQEGGYVIYVPSLPGCISEGDSKEEALKNIKEAIELYLEPTENPVLANSAEVAEVAV